MLFGAVLVGMWLAYFCSSRDGWRAVPAILVTWVVSSLPLLPIMSKYLAVHDYFALRRSLVERAGFSARAALVGASVEPVVALGSVSA